MRWIVGMGAITLVWSWSGLGWTASAPTSYAVLIGVGSYRCNERKAQLPPLEKKLCEGLTNLQGPPRDVQAMRKMLLGYGFRRKHIHVLLNRQATKRKIQNALYRLRRRARSQDRVLIYYTGHGSRVVDRDGDEPDRCDETLLPYDANQRASTHIVDDWIARWLQGFRTRNVVLIIDSCFAGGITRSMTPGKRWSSVRAWHNPNVQCLPPSRWSTAVSGTRRNKVELLGDSDRYTFLGASQAFHVAFDRLDGKGGVFTSMLLRVMKELRGKACVSFEAVWRRILKLKQKPRWLRKLHRMGGHQVPRFWGNKGAAWLFSTPWNKRRHRRCSRGSNPLCLTTWMSRMKGSSTPDVCFKQRDLVQVHVRVNRRSRISLWMRSTQGKEARLFPNPYHKSRWLEPGVVYKFPPNARSYKIRAKGPAGPSVVWVEATTANERMPRRCVERFGLLRLAHRSRRKRLTRGSYGVEPPERRPPSRQRRRRSRSKRLCLAFLTYVR